MYFYKKINSEDETELVLKSSVNQITAKEEYNIMKKLDHKNIVKVRVANFTILMSMSEHEHDLP